ncbi:MAG TPA: zinc-binding alcohol dehydrogenase [Rubrobacteraceae bacterium]|nr:zinc-binding alcohol dehydrogenase [Rubrobacteraceae bacterium]
MPEGLEARALWFAAPRTAELRSENAPAPGPGEVRVRALASAISGGTEMLVYRGEVPEGMQLDLPTLAGSYGFPIKYGYAAVGHVLDIGSHVQRLSPGDPVFVHHPHQDFFTVPAHTPVRLPEGLDPLLGVYCANLETALNIVHDTPLRLGETALVLGQGVVGLLVTQLLKISGAGEVLVVDPFRKRRDLALAVGADAAFKPDEELGTRLREMTGGRGADVVVEVSGSGEALQAGIEHVADEGTVVVASWYGAKPVSLSLGGHFHRGRVKIRSSQVGRISPELGPRWDRDRRMVAVLKLLPRLRLEGLISHRIPFEKAPEAYRLLDENPEEVVQVILTYERS